LSNIKYLIVDEYQDVNDLQEKLIASIANQGANVCVVGDDDQTIYQFRGSNANNMIGFSKRYKDVHQVKLEENFRCKIIYFEKRLVELFYNK
jgi:DNA helicase-2/ATP-dependent DNA helicase PcrA